MNFKFILFIIVLIVSIFFLSCARVPDIQFCEGLTIEGKGKNCGTVFTTGELTAIIRNAKSFGSNSITVNIYQKRNNLQQKIQSIDIEVKNTDTQTNDNLPFYNTGVFQVEATANGVVFGRSSITIQD